MKNYFLIDRYCFECHKIKPTEGFLPEFAPGKAFKRYICADCAAKQQTKRKKVPC